MNGDFSWIAALGPFGLIILSIVALVFIISKWALPTFKDISLDNGKKIDNLNNNINGKIDSIVNDIGIVAINVKKNSKSIEDLQCHQLKSCILKSSVSIPDRISAYIRLSRLIPKLDDKIQKCFNDEILPGNEELYDTLTKLIEET